MIYREFGSERIPALGFGTYHLRGDEGVKAIRYALETGYRHLDTASRYENEVEVGRAIRESGVPRDRIFLATKLRYTELDPDEIETRARESLDRLRVDYVDLIMPHWPSLSVPVRAFMPEVKKLKSLGLTRHIGISNFPTAQMREALDILDGELFTNQIEYHPFLNQQPIADMVFAHGALVTAAVPLARGAIEECEDLKRIAASHGKSTAQVTLRWMVQQPGVIAIPKSSHAERIKSNFEIFDFELSEVEMAQIFALQGNRRLIDPHWAPVWDPVPETT